MPGGNIDDELKLNGNMEIIAAEGSLTYGANETMTRVEVWVVQKSTGASHTAYQDNNFLPGPVTRWKATKTFNKGKFATGDAFGMVFAISKLTGGSWDYAFWQKPIKLT